MTGLIKGHISGQEQLCADIYRMRIDTGLGLDIAPGQFINLYTEDEAHLLPRPISVFDASDIGLTIVYRTVGYGTNYFSRLSIGDEIRLMAPLGNGYPLNEEMEGSRLLLIGGGLGIPPMYYLAKKCIEKNISVSVVLGYRDDAFLISDFEELGVPIYTSSDSGRIGVRGTVADCIKDNNIDADIWMACGPLPMLRALKDYSAENNIKLFVSLEERMACGVGACLGCVCPTEDMDEHMRVHNRRVCKDGPVFDAGEVVL